MLYVVRFLGTTDFLAGPDGVIGAWGNEKEAERVAELFGGTVMTYSPAFGEYRQAD